jgi:phosphopentomutase
MKRVFLIVMDACGVGAMPDWEKFDDPHGANTLANVSKACDGLHLPNLQRLGLGNITSIQGVAPSDSPIALFGKAAEFSFGKDTTTGHWEMAGLPLDKPFPVYPKGFPKEIVDRFIELTGCGGILCNEPASGTEVLVRLGEKHLETGWPIIYTSADSVFQIATNAEKYFAVNTKPAALLQGLSREKRVKNFAASPSIDMITQSNQEDKRF